jgi:MFS family permease
MGVAGTAWQFVGLRAADRIGKGVRTPPRDAMIADCTPTAIRGRAFGVQRAMDSLGAAIGPLIAFAILWFWPGNVGYVFLATLVPGVLVMALVLFGLRESSRQVQPAQPAPAPFTLTLAPFGRPFKLYLVALVIFTLGNTSDMFLLARSGELGVPAVWIPILWCAFNVISSLGSLAAGSLVDRLGARLPILAGWLLYAAVYLGFALATSQWHAWVLFLSYALFYSLTEPAEKAAVAQLAEGTERRGLAYGWFNFAVGIATLPANLFFGWLYLRFDALVAFGFGAAMAALAAALLLSVRPHAH